MSLGILGGTFNPIHRAHLRLAEVACAELALTRMLFVPAGDPPLKHSAVAPAHHRLAMVRLALADRSDCEVLDVELTRQGPSYTVDTLALLHERHPGERLWFIVGAVSVALFFGIALVVTIRGVGELRDLMVGAERRGKRDP